MPEESIYSSIVVVGAMNPALHQPNWYETAGILPPEEVASLDISSVAITPLTSQFSTKGFRVTCQQQRWDIGTVNPEFIDRLPQIVNDTFHKLYETPLERYGLNFNFHRKVGPNLHVGSIMSHLAQIGLFGLAYEAPNTVSITHLSPQGRRTTQIQIAQSARDPSMVYVAFNADYKIEEQGYFELGDLIKSHFSDDKAEAEEVVARIVKTLVQSIGG